MAKWAYMRRYNPDDEWKSYTYDVYFGGGSATVHVAISKINLWSDDVAAYAFLRQVCSINGGSQTCAFWASEESAPTTGSFQNISKVTMELRLYGPILADATLLGVA
jgi:hypothetical protein